MADVVVYIDALDGLKRVMNNKKLYVKLLNKFKGEAYLADLTAALGAGDLVKAQSAAHTIKGVAANLSLLALSKEALDLETQIKAGEVNPGALESLAARYGETLAEIDKVIAEYAG